MDEHSTYRVQRYYLVFEKLYCGEYGQSRLDQGQKVNKTWMSIPRVALNATNYYVKNYTAVSMVKVVKTEFRR